MARQRSTWKSNHQAASSRTADVYTMNQDHPQPSPVDYENGDPDSWAETPTKNGNINKTYDGDSEARNEIGLGEFSPDTWDHKGTGPWGDSSGKYDNQRPINASTRKAAAAERVAGALLRTANSELIEQQALDLMAMPDNILVATLKRLDQVSPDSLSKEAKLRRSYACCKLAAAALPEKVSFKTEGDWTKSVHQMASTFASLDDPTLKSLLRQAAAAAKLVVASEEEEEEETGDTASAPASEEEEVVEETASAPIAAKPPVAAKPPFEGAAPPIEGGDTVSGEITMEGDEGDEGDVGCMSEGDAAMLNSMTQGPSVPAAPAPLTDLFGGPQIGMPGEMPAIASDAFDIGFDDDESHHTASGLPDGSDLASVFGDNAEVQAQREIRAAEREQAQREFGGYSNEVRTASEGAKKLGQVSRTQKQGDDQLAGLWS